MVQEIKLYLLESYLPNIEFDKDSAIVALTPEVCYHLDKAAIKYSIPEDYYDQHDLLPSKEHLNLFDQWITKIDELLYTYVEEVREYNLKLASLYAFYFQYRVLDQLFAKCYVVNRLLEILKPSEVVFVTHHSDSTVLDFTFHSTGQSYYFQIIPSTCNKHNIPLRQYTAEGSTALKHSQAILTYLSQSRTLQNIRFAAKYLISPTLHKGSKPLNIFLPKNTHIGLDFVIAASKSGHKIYSLRPNGYDILTAIAYNSFRIQDYGELQFCPKVFGNTDKILGQSELYMWFNEYFQADVSMIILKRLHYFILDICPLVIAYYKAFLQFYKQAKIDTLLMAHDALPHESAALQAANALGLNTVCIVHGDNICDVRCWGERDAKTYKTIIASNPERKEYYEQLGVKKVYVSPHRLSPQLKLKRSPKQGTVIYIASLMSADNRGLDGGTYPDTFLYKLQKAIVEYLATNTPYSFIFKGLPQADLLYNPIPAFIRDSKFNNIQASAKPFIHHLKYANKVICDVPSTGFYEAVVAGVPAMALYHTSWSHRQSAIAYFGNLVKPFSTIAEAIAHIDIFLNANPTKYITKLNTGNDSILDILEQQCP